MTHKQKAFVEHYAGNATEAAIKAGYSRKTAYSQGERLLKNVEVSAAIKNRERMESHARIATRQRRQEFWTGVMVNGQAEMKDRLKASELLGKSEGDFLDRVAAKHDGELIIRWEE
jgi:phage terminase small subunit